MDRIRCVAVAVGVALSAPVWAQQAPDESWGLPTVGAPGNAPSPSPPVRAAEPAPRPAPADVDEHWSQFPGESTAAPASGETPSDVPLTSDPPLPPVSSTVKRVPRPPEEPNKVSIYGAPSLGQWKRGLGLYIGFPLLGIRAAIGVTNSLDVGLGFDSFYGPMNEVRIHAKYAIYDGSNWSVAAAVEGGKAFFAQPPSSETNGARWLTGRRNWNFSPGVIISYHGDLPRSARLFLDARYLLAVDTQPFQKDPLGGVPSSLQFGHNVPVRFGAEMPFTKMTSFLFTLGFDIHGRAEDSNFMPVCAVGIVTSL